LELESNIFIDCSACDFFPNCSKEKSGFVQEMLITKTSILKTPVIKLECVVRECGQILDFYLKDASL
jgi:hypothetical protein